MAKGHIVFGIVVLVTMILLPAVALFTGETAPVTAIPQAQSQNGETVVQVLRTHTGKTEEYSLQDYLFGVVAAEMPMSYEDEALKAQCVAAHTLYVNRGQTGKNQPISDDSATDQAFITKEVARAKWGDDADTYEQRLVQLVAQVAEELVLYEGEPALTVYHALSAGRTESAKTVWGSQVDYLTPVESVGDVLSEGYISKKSLSKTEFLEGLATLSGDLSTDVQWEQAVGDIRRSQSGTVTSAVFFGKEFSGGDIRSAFSLRSANFDVEIEEEQVTFVVRGYGHLVGMSQFGANTMAQQGSNYREILQWYYPGCTVDRWDD